MKDFLTCFIILIILILVVGWNIGLRVIYVKQHNAPLSCMFAQDTVICVQLAKEK